MINLKKCANFFNIQLYPISLYSRQIAGSLVIFVIAHYLSVYDYGLFSSYKSISYFCLLFANLGFSEYILVSSQNIIKEVKLKISFFLIAALIMIFIVCSSLIFIDYLESRLLFILVLIRTFLDVTFIALILPYFQASKKFNIISYANIFYSIMIILIAVISYVFKLSLVQFLVLNIIMGLFNFIQLSCYAKINYILGIKYFKNLLLKLNRSIFVYMGACFYAYIFSQIQSLYVATYLKKEDAALYFSAFNIASIIGILFSAQVQKMLPNMIKSSNAKVRIMIKKELIFIMTLNILLLIFFCLFGKFLLLLLYGQKYYQNAYPILLILTVSNISIALAAIYGAYITASGNQHIKIKEQIIAIIIAFFTILIFNKLKIYAAVLSYFFATIYIGVVYFVKANKLLDKDMLSR